MRLLGIDYGKSKIGLSISAGRTALPLQVIVDWQPDELLRRLREIIEQEEVVKIVVGMPLNFSRLPTKQSQSVFDFANWLKDNLPVEVVLADETLTSKLAQKQGSGSQDDAQAAAYILQSYLDKFYQHDA